MADYIGMCRSTEFEVKDYDKFMEGLERVVMDNVTAENREGNKVIIFGYAPIPNEIEVEDEDGEVDYDNFDFPAYIKDHIKEGERMRITEIGYEKLRYLIAIAYDITADEVKVIDASVYDKTIEEVKK